MPLSLPLLALQVVCYAAGYYGLKALHERLVHNLLHAEILAHLEDA